MNSGQTIFSSKEMKEKVDTTPFYVFFGERLYLYDESLHMICAFMLKEEFDPENHFEKEDKTAAEIFAKIEMKFKTPEEEKNFSIDDFEDVVLSELEVWLSYGTVFGD